MLLLLLQLQGFLEWRGVDMSQLSTEDKNGTDPPFREAPGSPREDALMMLQSNGANTFRMRLWNSPCADGRCNASDFSYASPAGALDMARRATAANLSFVLDLHYSDWWADPGQQIKPAAWAQLPFDELNRQVFAWTRRTVAEFVARGTPPSTVQVGNEVSNGFLWNEKNSSCNTGGRLDGACSRVEGAWSRFGGLIAQGIRGARAACPSCEVAIHTDLGNHIHEWGVEYVVEWYSNLSAALRDHSHEHPRETPLDFERIGLSLYPEYCRGHTLESVRALSQLARAFPAKAIYIAETAYPAEGNEQPEPAFNATPAGQLSYISAVWTALRAALPHPQAGGLLWWEGHEGGDWRSIYDDDNVARPALLEGFRAAPGELGGELAAVRPQRS